MKIHTHQTDENHPVGESLIVDHSAHAIVKKITDILPLIEEKLDFMLEPSGLSAKEVTGDYLRTLPKEDLQALAEIIFPLVELIHNPKAENLSKIAREIEAGLQKIAFILTPNDDSKKTNYTLHVTDRSKPRLQMDNE